MYFFDIYIHPLILKLEKKKQIHQFNFLKDFALSYVYEGYVQRSTYLWETHVTSTVVIHTNVCCFPYENVLNQGSYLV